MKENGHPSSWYLAFLNGTYHDQQIKMYIYKSICQWYIEIDKRSSIVVGICITKSFSPKRVA